MKKTLPVIEHRDAHPYAAVRLQVAIPFGKSLQTAWLKVHHWLQGQGVVHGPAIIRYLTTDMSTKLDLDVGFVLDQAIAGGDGVITAVLPAGQYATLMHIGPYKGKGIYKANVTMMEWANSNNIRWAIQGRDGVEWWDSRVEWYFSDPDVDPDPKKYKTELTFLLNGGA